MIDKQKLLTLDDLPRKQVDTPEWGPDCPHVFVRMLNATELVALDTYNEDGDGKSRDDFLWRFAAFMLCQEDGSRLFTDGEADDGILRGKRPDVLRRIVLQAQAHNGVTEESRAKAAKNSESGQTDSNT